MAIELLELKLKQRVWGSGPGARTDRRTPVASISRKALHFSIARAKEHTDLLWSALL